MFETESFVQNPQGELMLITIDLNQISPCRNCPHLLQMLSGGQPAPKQPQKPSANLRGRRGRPDSIVQAAVEWLKEYLKDGPKPSGNKNAAVPEGMFGDARTAGFTYATINRAATTLGVHKEKIDRRYYWSLPAETSVASETN